MSSLLQAFDRLEPFTVTAPIGTTAAAPSEVNTNFAQGQVVRIELVIPTGHNGLTGIAIAQAHSPIFPDRRGAFIIDNGRTLEFTPDDRIQSGQWSAFVFNTSQVPHNFYLRYYVLDANKTAALTPQAPQPIDFSRG